MNAAIRNILAVIVGLIVGSLVNMALVSIGPMIVPLPDGANVSTLQGLSQSMHHFTPANFLFPFLAHALGTFSGAFVAAKIAVSYPMQLAMLIGVIFLVGGITMVRSVGGPMWFNLSDLLVAYIPMAILGGGWGSRN